MMATCSAARETANAPSQFTVVCNAPAHANPAQTDEIKEWKMQPRVENKRPVLYCTERFAHFFYGNLWFQILGLF